MKWDFNNPLFHPQARDKLTASYGHNKRLHAWFALIKMNGLTFCAEKGADDDLTTAGIFCQIATNNGKVG